MGRNGVGKTTLLRLHHGAACRCVGGSIAFDGERPDAAPRRTSAPRSASATCRRGGEIFPLLTVEENLRIGLAARAAASAAVPDLVFELFPVLKEMLRRRGGDLSGGQQQQLAIGRALVLDPKLLILDEPTEGIQPNIVHEIGDIIRRLNREHGAHRAAGGAETALRPPGGGPIS